MIITGSKFKCLIRRLILKCTCMRSIPFRSVRLGFFPLLLLPHFIEIPNGKSQLREQVYLKLIELKGEKYYLNLCEQRLSWYDSSNERVLNARDLTIWHQINRWVIYISLRVSEHHWSWNVYSFQLLSFLKCEWLKFRYTFNRLKQPHILWHYCRNNCEMGERAWIHSSK